MRNIFETMGVILRPLPSDELDKPRQGIYRPYIVGIPEPLPWAYGPVQTARTARDWMQVHHQTQPQAPSQEAFWESVIEHAQVQLALCRGKIIQLPQQ